MRRISLALALAMGAMALTPTSATAIKQSSTSASVRSVNLKAPVELTDGSYVPGELLVEYDNSSIRTLQAANTSITNVVSKFSTSRVGTRNPRLQLIEFDESISVEDAINNLRNTPGIARIAANHYRYPMAVPDDPSYTSGTLWGLEGSAGTRAETAWADGHTGSRDVIVAVLDTGTQIDHPDLAANIWSNPREIPGNGVDDDGNGYVDDVNGWDFLYNDSTVYDSVRPGEDNHGTHVSGTIGGVGNNGIGVVGVNWEVSILPVKFLGDTSSTIVGELAALDYILDFKDAGHNIVAVNNSWGCDGAGCANPIEQDKIEEFGEKGILFVVASGNSASDNDQTPSYPASYTCDGNGTRDWDCIITVTAHDVNGEIPDWSGPSGSTYVAGGPSLGSNVDISAPGEDIYSTLSVSSYGAYRGTSMATPHVTGAVALCASVNPNMTARAIRAALLGTANVYSDLATLFNGGGLLNVASLLDRCAATPAVVDGAATISGSDVGTLGVAATYVDVADVAVGDIAEVRVAEWTNQACGDPIRTQFLKVQQPGMSQYVEQLALDETYCLSVRVHATASSTVTDWSEYVLWTTRPAYRCTPSTYNASMMSAGQGGTDLELADDDLKDLGTLTTAYFSTTASDRNLTVFSNGYVSLNDVGNAQLVSGSYIHPLPYRGVVWPDSVAAPWMADLDPSEAGAVRYVADADGWTLVTWDGVPHWTEGASSTSQRAVTFQFAIERATGTVVFQYLDATFTEGTVSGPGLTSNSNRAYVSLPEYGTITDESALRCTFIAPSSIAMLRTLVGDGGSISGLTGIDECTTSCATYVERGDPVELVATPEPGYAFVRWRQGCTGTDPTCVVPMNSDVTVEAEFREAQSLTIEMRGSGSGSVVIEAPATICTTADVTCEVTGFGADSLELRASPGTGSTFVGWSANCSVGVDPLNCEVQLEPESVITATFDLDARDDQSFKSLVPARILDTRSGDVVGELDGSGAVRELRVTGAGGVPLSGVSAVALNVTAVSTETNDFGGFVTVFPCGTRPDASNLNFTSGMTIPNSVIAPVSSDGKVCFYVYGKAHLLADVSGYFVSGFEPLTPDRIMDTRSGDKVGELDGSGAVRELQVTGAGGVPVSDVSAVALNVTAVSTETNDFGGFVTVFPCGTRPDASNLNFMSGMTIPNSVIAPVSAAGKVCFYVYGKTHLLADVSGYFSSGFESLTPDRIMDTRSGDKVGELDGSGSAYELQVTGAGGVPSTGVSAVALNVTAVSTETNDFGGFVTVFPCGTRPDASNLNFTSGMTIPNSVIAPVSDDGKVCFYVYGKAHLLADVSGYLP